MTVTNGVVKGHHPLKGIYATLVDIVILFSVKCVFGMHVTC